MNCRWGAENTPTGLPHLFAEACIFGKPKKGQTRVLMVNEKKSPRPPRCPPGAPPRAVSGHRFPRWRCYAYVRKTPLLAPQKRVFCTFPLYTGPDRPQMTTFTHILPFGDTPCAPRARLGAKKRFCEQNRGLVGCGYPLWQRPSGPFRSPHSAREWAPG